MFAWVPFLPGDVGSDVHAQDVVRTSHAFAAELKQRKWAVERLRITQENRQSFSFAASDAETITNAEWSDNEDERKISDSLDHIDVHSNLAKAHNVTGNLVALWGEKLGKTTVKVEFQRNVAELATPPKKGESDDLDFNAILAHRNKTKLHVELQAVDFGVGAPLVPPTPAPTPEAPAAPEKSEGGDAKDAPAEKAEVAAEKPAEGAAPEATPADTAAASSEAKPTEGAAAEAKPEAKAEEKPAENAGEATAAKPAEPEKKPEPPKQRFGTLRGKVLVAPGMEKEHWYAKASPLVHVHNGKEKFETAFKKDTDQHKNEWNQEFTLTIEVVEQEGTLVAVHPLHVEIRDHSSFWKNTILAEADLSIADLKHEEKVEREILLVNEDVSAFVTGNKDLAGHSIVHAQYIHKYLSALGWAGSFCWSYGNIDLTEDGKIPTGSFAFKFDIPLEATEYSETEKPAGLAANVQDWVNTFVGNAHHLAVVLTEGLSGAESQNTTGSTGAISFDERVTFGGKEARLQLSVGLEILVAAAKAAEERAKAAAEKAAAEKAAAEKAAAEKAAAEKAEKEAAEKAAAEKAAAEKAAVEKTPADKAAEKTEETPATTKEAEVEKAAEAETPAAEKA